MQRFTWLLLPALLMLAVACGGSSPNSPTATQEPSSETTGSAVFSVSDAAADMGAVSEINLTVDGLRVRNDAGAWVSVETDASSFSLLELRDSGAAALLAEVELEPGLYDRLELEISSVTVVDGRGEHSAKLPTDLFTLEGELMVEANSTASADFDFIADESLHSTVDGQFVFAPVIELETKSDVQVVIGSGANAEVEVSGGSELTNIRLGTDVNGNVDAGLRITPNAALEVNSSGGLVQTGGAALLKGTIKSVDTANGAVTIVLSSGAETVLHMAADSELSINGSATGLEDLAASVGATVMAEYNAKQGTLAELSASTEANGDVSVGLNVSGVLKAVNEDENTITIQTDDGAEVTIKVDSNADVKSGGLLNISGLLGLDAAIGSRVEAEYGAEGSTASDITVEGETDAEVTVTGTLKSVDAASGTAVIKTSEGEKTLLIESSTDLTLDGSAATLANLSAHIGANITAQFNPETGAASYCEAESNTEASASVTVNGTLESVQPLAGTITVTAENGERLVLDVTASSQVLVEGTVSSLVSLALYVGEQVKVKYDADTNTALRIETEANASVSGTIEAVNAAAGTITIAAENGQRVVLEVASDTVVMVNSSATAVAELSSHIGANVDATFSADAHVASQIEVDAQATVEATVSGTIEAVNAASGTLTVVAENGQRLTLEVVSETQVLVNGSAQSLVELAAHVGSTVTVTYNTETKVATEVSASAEASATATVNGTLEAVDTAAGTVTIAADSGQEVVLNVTSATRITAEGAVTALVNIAANIGSRVSATYDAETNVASDVSVEASQETDAEATVKGTLESVNAFSGSVVVLAEDGTRLTLSVASSSEILINEASSTLVELAARVNSEVSVTFDAETNTVTQLSVS